MCKAQTTDKILMLNMKMRMMTTMMMMMMMMDCSVVGSLVVG